MEIKQFGVEEDPFESSIFPIFTTALFVGIVVVACPAVEERYKDLPRSVVAGFDPNLTAVFPDVAIFILSP